MANPIIYGWRLLVNLERRKLIQWQTVAIPLHRILAGHYKHQLQIQANPQKPLDAPKIKTLAPCQPDILNMKVIREANCSNDNFMIKYTAKLQRRWWMRKDKMPIRKLATYKIIRVKDYMQASLNDRFAEIPAGTVEE